MENFINITSKINIINLGYTKKSNISQLALLKSKIIILLTSNDLIIYDINSPEDAKHRHFIEEIQLIRVFQDKLFILQNKMVIQMDSNNLDELQRYDLKEKAYLIEFKDTTKNFICFYINEINEIIYMNSYFLTEIKRLYKETDIIEKILYQNNILLWCTKSALKVFNLEIKSMLLKTDLTNYTINNNEKMLIECYLYNNLLGLIYQQKYIFIYYLDTDNKIINNRNRTSFEIYNSSINPVNKNEYFIGMWINLSMTKICIISLKNNIICLDISKLDMSKYNRNFFYNSKNINYCFHKEYKYINKPDHDIKFIIGKQNMFLYDKKEIYLISYSQDKENNFFQIFLNNNEINFDDIKNNYKSMNLNRKYFILVKIIEKDSKNNFNLFLNDNIFLEQYKYLYDELFNLKNLENIKNKDKISILYNNYILYLLKISINIFIKLYLLIKNNFDKFLDNKTKEKIIKYLMQEHQYNILQKFISKDNNKILYTPSLEEFIQIFKASNEKYKEEIIYIEALLNQKVFLYKNAIKLFIDIKKINEIYDILLMKNQTILLFDYDILFDMFEESKLVNILDALYSPLNIDNCLIFYKKLFSLCNEIKITKFAYFLILYEKYRLLINNEIIQKLFKISIKNNNTMIFENIYEKYKYKSDNKLFLTKFIREVFNIYNINNKKIIEENINELMKAQNIDIYILLLTNVNNYKKIIDIYIDHLEKPEECIKYIENSNLNQNIKQDIYNYLGNKINNSKSLSEAKKFYYITQFQDDITIKKPDILKLFDNIKYDKKNSDDYDYILLILKELRLKLNTLQTTKEMCVNSSKEVFNELKKNLKRGKIMQLNIEKPNENKGLNNIIKNKKMNTIKMKCDFDECDYQKFELGDNLVIFKECNHCYHKDCFQNIKNIYENDNNKFYIDNNFCPKCFDII
jgi:hypothetical protein